MPDSFLLRDWQSFYLLTGTAGATLIGLIFLAISLGARLVPTAGSASLRAFVVPIVTHFSAVLLLSGLLLIPAYTRLFLGGTLLAGGLAGLGYDLEVARQLRRHHLQQETLDWRHWLWHWLVPSAGFALVAVAGLALLLGRVDGLPAAAFGSLVLLYVGLRNAFDLFLWIARQTNG